MNSIRASTRASSILLGLLIAVGGVATAQKTRTKTRIQLRNEELAKAQKECVAELMNLARGVGAAHFLPPTSENRGKMKAYSEEAARIMNKHKAFHQDAEKFCRDIMSAAQRISGK